jgi:hypothetical protein
VDKGMVEGRMLFVKIVNQNNALFPEKSGTAIP